MLRVKKYILLFSGECDEEKNRFLSKNLTIKVYVLGHKYILGLTQSYFNLSLQARIKMTLSRDQNIFRLKNVNSSTDYYYDFGGHWENKNWKNNNNTIDTTTRMYSSLTGFIFPQWKYTFQWNWQEISKSCDVSFFQKLLKVWKESPSLSTAYLFISCLDWAIFKNILAH